MNKALGRARRALWAGVCLGSAAAVGSALAAPAATPVSRTKGFYASPWTKSWVWSQANPYDFRMPAIRDTLGRKGQGIWFGGWESNIGSAVKGYVDAAAAQGLLPVLVAYHIPQRDCGGLAAGGVGSASEYRSWISAFAQAVGTRPAVVILEPDALAQLDCLPSNSDRATRLSLMSYAVDQFASKAPGAWVYLDAGNSAWLPAQVAAARLAQAGVARARGFVLNVSNYRSNAESTSYGLSVNATLKSLGVGAKPFALDTGRNGNGPGSTWCDPAGRKVGDAPQVVSVGGQPEMKLWVKPPGEVDGCVPATNGFSADLAYRLVRGY